MTVSFEIFVPYLFSIKVTLIIGYLILTINFVGSNITRKNSGLSRSSQMLNQAHPTQTFTPVPSITNTVPGDAPTVVATKTTVSSGVPLSVKSSSTSVVHPSSSSVKTGHSKSFSRNPYILNKSSNASVSSTKAVAQKSELKWTRPSSSAMSTNDDVTSHSDSELYTKRSSHSTAKKMPNLFFTRDNTHAVLKNKVPSSSNVQLSSYKWSRAGSNTITNTAVNKWRKAKVEASRPQWTHPKAHQIGIGQHANLYVRRKSSVGSTLTVQKPKAVVSKQTTSKVAK